MLAYLLKSSIDFATLALLYFLVFYPRWRRRNHATLLINTLFYIYLSFVLFFTLMPILTSLPFIFNHPYTPMNLTPFIDVSAGYGDYQRQIILNIIMTIPFGFLFPLTQRHPSFAKTILYTFLLSLSIELIQPLLSSFRFSDITDIITNVFGGIIGYLCYLPLRPALNKFLHRLQPHPQASPESPKD